MTGSSSSKLVDSSALVHWLRAERRGLPLPFGLAGTSTNWLRAGLIYGNASPREREQLERIFASLPAVSFGEGTTEKFADVYTALRRAGTPTPTNDIWIAASALEHDLELWTRDAHFDKVPGLRVRLVA